MPQPKATSFYSRDIPDLNGYIGIVTGGNSGIGYETTLQLALHGARVYIAARSAERIDKAIADMKASHGETLDLFSLEMDLQSFQIVKDTTGLFMRKESRLDILINNAGIMAVPFKLTIDGYETQWQTDYLAPFFLVQCLLPILESTAAASTSKSRVRIVNVSGDTALVAGMGPKELDLARPNLEHVTGPMSGWKRYGHAKLASIIHARALHARLGENGITAYAIHPGIIKTNLQSADPSLFGVFVRHAIRLGIMPGLVSVADGARTSLFCAVDERAVEGSGNYFLPFGVIDDKRTAKWCDNEKIVNQLWEESWRMIRDAGF